MDTRANVLNFVETTIEQAQTGRIPAAAKRHTVNLIEQMLHRAAKSARQVAPHPLPNWGERPLTPNERGAIEALVNYQAANTGLTPFFVESALLHFFNVEETRHMTAWNYDAAVRYLVDFQTDEEIPVEQAAA